jgi:TPR repeat protein
MPSNPFAEDGLVPLTGLGRATGVRILMKGCGLLLAIPCALATFPLAGAVDFFSNSRSCDPNGGDAFECYRLGENYADPFAPWHDKRAALRAYNHACNADNHWQDDRACWRAAEFYEHGDAVRRDERRAVKLYRRACPRKGQRIVQACVSLAVMKRDGRGTRVDTKGAIALLEWACEHDLDACRHLRGGQRRSQR